MSVGAITAIILNLLFFHIGRQTGANVATSGSGEKLTLDQINAMDREQFVDTLSPLFNSRTWPLEIAWESRPFANVTALREAIQISVLTAPLEAREDLIHDYPDMAQLLLADQDEAAEISRDRGSIGLEELDDVDRDKLLTVTSNYRDRFGMPYVAYFDTTDTVDDVVAEGLRRLDNSDEQEHRQALSEIIEIANDRFDIVLEDANPARTAFDRKFTDTDFMS